MRKLLKISLVLTVILNLNCFQTNAQEAKENALLWEISGGSLEKPSYLFGTIHLICEDQYVLEDAVVEALKRSDKVAMELDMDDPQMMGKMQQLMVSPGMKNIKSSLEEEEIIIVDEFLKGAIGQGIDQVGILKPFALNSMVLTTSLSCPVKTYETELMALAQANKQEIVGLETVEFQIGLFDALDYDKQVDQLVESIQNPEETQKMMDKLMLAYTSKDLALLWEVIDEDEDYEGFNEDFLFKRNRAWIDNIVEYSNQGSVFYAVGAGHLLSENGVIALLRDKGYTVKAVQ